MEPKYIFAIVAVGLFFIFFLIFFMLLAYRRNAEAKLQAYIQDFYSDKNLLKIDYDSAADENMPQVVEGRRPITAASRDDEETQLKIEEVFTKVEVEGIEEITGNYQP